MAKIFVVPNNISEYVLSDKEIEILVLNKNMKRLEIKYAPSLKKIISLSSYIVFGPEELKADIPVLNKCKNLNEIITFGNIKFNTMISTNGINEVCAWTGVNEVPPTITSVGSEYMTEVPCFYYDLKAPIEEVDSTLLYAYPLIRECPLELIDIFMNDVLENPDEVSKVQLYKQPTKKINFLAKVC